MPRQPEQVIPWALAHPNRANGQRWSWPGPHPPGFSFCEDFVYNAGGFTETFGSATEAADASGPLVTDPAEFKPWMIVYFSGGENDWGHDGILDDTMRLLCASTAGGTPLGNGSVAVASVDEYLRQKPFMTLRGATYRHGTETLEFPTPTPPAPPKRKKMNMNFGLIGDSTGAISLVRLSDGATRGIGYPEYAAWLSSGLTLQIVPNDQYAAWLAAHPWTDQAPVPSGLLDDLKALVQKYS